MPTDVDVTDQNWQLWREFLTMHRHLARTLDRRLQRDAGISQADFSVLLRLSEATTERLRIGELAELLAWEKSRVSHQVTRMEARTLLTRSDCVEDGRGTWIELTDHGRRVLEEATADHAAAIRTLFLDRLGDDEKVVLGEISRRVLDGMNTSAWPTTSASAA